MPSVTRSGLVALAASVATVSAHGYVAEITADGVSYEGFIVTTYPYMNPAPDSIAWSHTALDLGYVAPDAFATPDIICHKESQNAALAAPVAAGGEVSMRWNTWPESHKGPSLWYMANCGGSCATVDKTTLEFFKIAESGLEGGVWATETLMANGLTGSVTIPAGLAAGNYVLRHELIALHGAGGEGGAQSYPSCVNLEVTGGGSDTPAGVLGTALYTPTSPGILFSLSESVYPIPGPPVYGGSGSTTTPATPPANEEAVPATPATPPANDEAVPATPATPPENDEAVPKTMVTRTRTNAAATSAPPTKEEQAPTGEGEKYTATPQGEATSGGTSAGGAALYAQCGGQGFSGPSTCASGTCTKLNDYYSQCL